MFSIGLFQFQLVDGKNRTLELAPTINTTVAIRYSPKSAGRRTAVLQICLDDDETIARIRLEGICGLPGMIMVLIRRETVAFIQVVFCYTVQMIESPFCVVFILQPLYPPLIYKTRFKIQSFSYTSKCAVFFDVNLNQTKLFFTDIRFTMGSSTIASCVRLAADFSSSGRTFELECVNQVSTQPIIFYCDCSLKAR